MFPHLWLHNCGFCLCPLPLTLGIHHGLLPWRRVHKPGSPAWAEKCNSRGPVRSQSSKLQWSHVTHGEASPAGLEVPRERGSPFLHSINIPPGLSSRETPAEFPWVNCLSQTMGSSASHSRLHIKHWEVAKGLGTDTREVGLYWSPSFLALRSLWLLWFL